MRAKLKVLIAVFFLVGCSSLKTRDRVRETKRPSVPGTPGQQGPGSTDETAEEDVEAMPTDAPLATPVAIPKIGLILGPGGARTFAHLGVLQEIQREKIPVVAVGGIEWGAPIAAAFAKKGLANEAEWQMMKLKSEDVVQTSLIGGSRTPDARALRDFFRTAFGNTKAEYGQVPFACPAHNLNKNQTFLMARGTFDQLLPYCVSYPPVLRHWQGNVAAVRDVKHLSDYLRERGATTVVLINVLPGPNVSRPFAGDEASAENILWNEIAALYAKPFVGVDHVLNIPLGATGVSAFDDRRELLQKGSERGAMLVKQLARRLGL